MRVAPMRHLAYRYPFSLGLDPATGVTIRTRLPALTEGNFMHSNQRATGVFKFERRSHFEIDLLKERASHAHFKRIVDCRLITEIKSVVGVPQQGINEVLDRLTLRRVHSGVAELQ